MREFGPLSADVPQNLQNVIAKGLAKQPKNRYAFASEMRDDLRRILHSAEVSDFLQPNLPQQFAPGEQTPRAQHAIPTVEPVKKIEEDYSQQTFLPETETSVLPISTLNSEQPRMSKRKDFVMFDSHKAKIKNYKSFVMFASDVNRRKKRNIVILSILGVLLLLGLISKC